MLLLCALLLLGPQAPLAAQESAPDLQQEVRAAPARLLTPQLLAAALTPPAGAEVAGRPVTLEEVLRATAGRGAQLTGTKTYWKLCQALGEYYFAVDDTARLQRLLVQLPAEEDEAADAGLARAACDVELNAAEAGRQEAYLHVVQLQYDLALTMGDAAGQKLPLPADRPHVGAYRTLFEQIFAGRTAPPQARLNDQLLPLERKLIDLRAASVRGADDAAVAAEEQMSRGQVQGDLVLARLAALARERRAFLEAVRKYNERIADYAFSVAGQATPAQLVAMLIKPQPPPAPEKSDAAGSGAENERQGRVQTSPATPDDQPSPRETLRPPYSAGAGEHAATSPQRRVEPGAGETTAAPPPTVAAAPPPIAAAAEGAGEGALFSGLAGLSPTKQLFRLAAALHWERPAPDEGREVSLVDCLREAPLPERRLLIAAYWRVRQAAARQQALSERVQQYAALLPAALALRQDPGGAEAMVALEAGRLRAAADLADEDLALWQARHELTRLAGQSLEGALLWPLTPPHAGRYDLKQDLAAAPAMRGRGVERLAKAVPVLYEVLTRRALAVVQADLARSRAAAAYRDGAVPLAEVLPAIERQAQATLLLLDGLTAYNEAIAEYALAVLPPELPAEKLVASLVVVPGKQESQAP